MIYFARWKIALVLVTCLAGILFAAPNFFSQKDLSSFPDFLPKQQVSLGLDLQGGSYLLLEVDVQAVENERLDGIVEEVRTALRSERIGYTGLGIQDKLVSVRIRKPEEIEQAAEILRGLATPVQSTVFGGGQQLDMSVEVADAGRIEIRMTEAALIERKTNAVEQSIEIVRRRVDAMGTKEPTIQRQGSERILVQLPGVDDPQRIKDILGTTAKLTFQLVDESVSASDVSRGRAPAGSVILPMDDGSGRIAIKKRIMVSGENLTNAGPTYDDRTSAPAVSFQFDTVGARKFGDATRKNVGRRFAIVLDKKVVSAPVIRSAIPGGSGIITGSFTIEEANDLAILLRAGALPAPLTILEERTVGAELGADSVEAGRIAAMIGFAAVIIYMGLSYGPFGWMANLALVMNIVLIGGALSGLGATLTLPGIAGIVLTVGMAVDANVLIFERIREELRAGKNPMVAVEKGYERALGTILDANITTLIAAAILFYMGSGPVKGFAVTLGIGIVTSVFTAFTLTRLMVAVWLTRARPSKLVL